MKKWKLYSITVLLGGFIFFLFGFAQVKNNHEKITGISVHFIENQPTFISAEKVNKLLIQSDAKLLNKAKSLINLHQIEQEVRKNQMLEDVALYVSLNGVLNADVVQRVPIARFQNGTESYYIDRQGLKMPLSSSYSARVPLVTGVFDTEKQLEFYNLIRRINADPFYKKQIIGYHLNENGDYVLSTRIGRHKILFGKAEKITQKLKKLKVFYKKKWNSKQMKEYKLINLKYNRQVVCSK